MGGSFGVINRLRAALAPRNTGMSMLARAVRRLALSNSEYHLPTT